MTDFDKDVLRMLRVFGPCSNAQLMRHMHLIDLGKTYRALGRLEAQGLVVHPKLQQWGISRLGREFFEKMPQKPLELFT